ncbi:MAG: non-ribosomal peptide synthetase, partial [uncultured bacterium]
MSSRSVGKALPGWYFYIMNSRRQLLPIGTAGEIYVGGVGVALEYLHNSELTAERFIKDPLQNGMIYRTG